MDFKDIKGKRHYLYDSVKEFEALSPNTEITGNWRVCHEGDWALTDDEHVCRILKRSDIYDDFAQKHKTLIRTVCGTYIAERHNMKMIGADGIPANIYSFAKTFKSRDRYRKDNKGEVKEMLFAKYVAKGNDVATAFKKVYKGANNKSYISKKTNELLKKESVRMAIDKEIEQILSEEGVSPRWIIEKYKDIVVLSERDSDKLRSLEALAKMSGLFETQTKKEQVTVWAGFSPEQQEVLGGGDTKILAHEEKETKDS